MLEQHIMTFPLPTTRHLHFN